MSRLFSCLILCPVVNIYYDLMSFSHRNILFEKFPSWSTGYRRLHNFFFLVLPLQGEKSQGRGKSTFPCSFNSKGSQDKKKQPSLVKLYSISKIAFYPHFPLQSQCIPAHLWLLEYLASLDIQTEAIRGRKTLTFWGKSGGKMQFCLSLKTFPKKIAIVLIYEFFFFFLYILKTNKKLMHIIQTRNFYLCLSQCVSQTYALLYPAYSSSAPFYIISDVTQVLFIYKTHF